MVQSEHVTADRHPLGFGTLAFESAMSEHRTAGECLNAEPSSDLRAQRGSK